jgi:hypothetical protein
MHPDPGLAQDQDQLAAAPIAPDMAPFADIPRFIWIAFLSAWALLFAIFAVAFTKDRAATLMIFTACFFALMTLGLPAALAGLTGDPHQSYPATIVTRTGRIPVSAAATQILLIPVAAVIGLCAFVVLAM